jgi:isocitrate dehydrogenase kinase/phosphatase
VFPETFAPFLLGNPAVREVFMKHHADLLGVEFWQSHKERIKAGYVHDVFPYERERRFASQFANKNGAQLANNVREKLSKA